MVEPNGMAKIRLKGGPKQYKTEPRATGVERLRQRAQRLVIDAHRMAAKNTGDTALEGFIAGIRQGVSALQGR